MYCTSITKNADISFVFFVHPQFATEKTVFPSKVKNLLTLRLKTIHISAIQ